MTIKKFILTLIEMDKTFYTDENIYSLSIESAQGQLGILPDHLNFFTITEPGFIKITDINHAKKIFFAEKGLLKMHNNDLQILSEKFYEASAINKDFFEKKIQNLENRAKNHNNNLLQKELMSYKKLFAAAN